MRNGLSTATAIDGALRGAQQMSGLIDSHKRRGLMDAEAQRSQERHDSQIASTEQDRNFQQEKMEAWREEQKRVRDERAKEAEEALVLSALVDQKYIDKGALSREQIAGMEKYPATSWTHLQSEEVGKAINVFEEIKSGKRKIPYNEKGIIDLSQDPEIADALIAADPNLVKGNKDGKKVRPHYLMPNEDNKSFKVGLDVEGDDSVRGLTVGRSSNDDDPIMDVTLESLFDNIESLKRAREMTAQPEFLQYAAERRGIKLPEQSKGFSDPEKHEELGWIQRGADGKLHPLSAGAGGKGAEGRSDLPARAQMIEYYKEMGYSDDEAVTMANSAVSNREVWGREFANTLLARSQAYDETPISPQEALNQALEIYDKEIKTKRRLGEAESPRATAPATEFGRQAGAMLDGGVPVPMRPQKQAPPAAIERLRADLEAGDESALQEFEEYFGYIPDGI